MSDSRELHDRNREPSLHTRLEGLAAFLPMLEDPAFSFGEWETREGTLGWYQYSQGALRFIGTAASLGWVSPDIDWMRWKDTDEAQRFGKYPDTIDSATPGDLVCLLTTLVRQDRFVEGSLGEIFESGMLTRIVRRASSLRQEVGP
jgi:hypothetical protein